MPAYKADRYLEPALASIRAQTYTEWELVIVEDGSRDRTEDMVKAFADSVSQSVRFLRHEVNAGLPATRNTGISAAKSDWIALLDSDDLWTADHLKDLIDTAERTGSEFVHSGSLLFDSDTGKELEVRAPEPETIAKFPLSLYLADYVVQPSSVLLHRNLWKKAGGFDPSFRYVEDREMWLRCARAGAKFAYTGRQTCLYRKHGSALTQHADKMAEASALALEKNLDWEAIPKSARNERTADAWISAGRIVIRSQPRKAQEFFKKALSRQFSVKTLGYWLAASMLSLKK